MTFAARLLLLDAALDVLLPLDGERARAAPILQDVILQDPEARLANPVADAAEFCLPGWRLNFHNRCVPKRRRWWFR